MSQFYQNPVRKRKNIHPWTICPYRSSETSPKDAYPVPYKNYTCVIILVYNI